MVTQKHNQKAKANRAEQRTLCMRPLSIAVHIAMAGGLTLGMLPNGTRAALPDPGAAWAQQTGMPNVFQYGTTTATFSDRNLQIDQRDDKVVLDWDAFNIGAGDSVRFQQPGQNSVAINRIHDAARTEIFGNLTANGQVYLINTNGILFGNGAQVNVRTLVASSLDITQEAIDNGILAPGVEARPAFEGGGNGAVSIAKGAVLRADGGRVLVFAPEVTNDGLIQTPDGQTVLAAGQKIYLSSIGLDNSTANRELLGQLLVEVDVSGVTPEALQAFLTGQSPTLPSGTATNRGVIEALRGNTSMVGLAVNQNGRVSATTTVQVGGSIRLVASDRGAARGGRVQLGENSTTEIGLELDSTATAVDAEAQPQSNVTLAGHSVHIERAAQILAKAGTMEISANAAGSDVPDALATQPVNDSRIRIADDTLIDVSGATITMPVSANLLDVELRGSQLQDSPYQRDGILRNAKITVDTRRTGVREDGSEWVGTPLADLRGDVAAIKKTVGERSLEGGKVVLGSQGDVLVEQDATIDVSGGAVQYLDDNITTTQLVSNGRVYDIADAPETQHYDQILNTYTKDYAKWGVRRIWDIVPSRREPGYVQGSDAGLVNVIASRGAFEGTLRGGVIVGEKQRQHAPQGGEFILGQIPSDLAAQNLDLRSPDVTFSPLKSLTALLADGSFNVYGGALPSAFDSFLLSPELFGEEAMHRGKIYSNGRILLPEDVNLVLPAGGALSLTAAHVDVQGDIMIPSGDITLKAVPINGNANLVRVDVGPHSRLDTRGVWVNDNPLFSPVLGPIFTGGGSVNISSSGGDGVFINAGSLIDVSGGGWLDAAGKLHAGNAGSISLRAASSGFNELAPVQLMMAGQLKGYALGKGGRLSVETNALCIGNAGCAGVNGLRIDPALFQQGGFGSYTLNTNLAGLTLAGDALIRPLAQSWLLNPGFALQRTGADLALFTRRVILPEVLRTPTSLSLSVNARDPGNFSNANFAQAGILDMSAGARILLDPRSSVSLASNTRILVAGSIVAPAGNIDLRLNNSLALNGYLSSQSLWLTDSARLDARGVAQLEPNASGQRVGEVYAGGNINLQAQRGYIVTETGAQLDVSGAAAILDLPNGNQGFVTRSIASDAGTISLAAAEGMMLDGTMHAEAGGAGAAGGQLKIALDATNDNRGDNSDSFDFPTAQRVLQVMQGDATQLPNGLVPTANTAFDALNGQARIAEDRIKDGGFDQLTLQVRNLDDQYSPFLSTGKVSLEDGVALSLKRDIRIDAAELESTGTASLAARYVAIGTTNRKSQDVNAPQSGTGQLSVSADLIDVIGNSHIQGAATTRLHSRGDIRLRGIQQENTTTISGSLSSAGDLELRADQVYPSTLSDFTLAVTDAGGTLSIQPGEGDAAPVLSAGGKLHLRADNIVQNGTLRAPIGSLNLIAGESLILGNGSLTSTSAEGQTIPFGRLEAGEDWVYALQEDRFRVFTGSSAEALPQKRVVLDSADIEVRDGAVVDVSGGGDLLAYEFVPGVDGTLDLLDPKVSPGLFAIVPNSGLRYAPYDTQEMVGSTLQPGDSITLSGSDGVPAGTYTLLPARYALLPGAWLIQQTEGYRDLPIGKTIALQNGTTIVSGYRSVAGTDIQDSRNSGFALRPGSDISQFGRYDTATANSFFPAAAERNETATPRLPGDAGTLAIAPRNALLLKGSLRATAATNARGSAVDIAAQLLAVTGSSGSGTVPAGYVQVSADQLNAFGAESLLLGALRDRGAGVTYLDVRATEVRVAGDAELSVPDLVIAARERIDIEAGAQLSATGTARTGDSVLHAEGDGASLRLSADEQVRIDRGATSTGAQGDLIIGAGAQLSAAQSAVLDATHDTQSQGNLIMDGGSLNLGAYRISLGDAGAASEGLVLGIDDLHQAQVDELVLTSRTSVDLYGAVNLAVNDLHIEAAGINGFANNGQTAQVQAVGAISLSNREGLTDSLVATGDGSLQLNATDKITLGVGEFNISGFDQVSINAGREIVGDGTGALSVAGALTLTAPRISATKGADTTIQAIDASNPLTPIYHQVTIAQPGTLPNDLPFADLGARMNIIGSRIEQGGNIVLNAGLLNLEARGDAATGAVNLLAGSSVDLSGRAVIFDTVPVYAPAGKFSTTSVHGDVVLNGAINLSAATDGGDAGRLTATATEGALVIGGALQAEPGQGGRGGEARLDANTLGDFSALNTTLNGSGFTQQRDLHQRSGDINIATTDSVSAHDIQITTDAGSINIAGSLDASGAEGGRVQLNADQKLNVAATAVLAATATTPDGDGGRVDLRSQNGGVFLNSGSVIDVRGGANGHGGEVHLRLPRSSVLSVLDASGANDQMQLAATILGAAQQLLEGHQVYTETDGIIDAAQVSTSSIWYSDASSFMNAVMGATAAAGDAGFVVRPGIEIQSPGDLTLTADWNLNTWRFIDQPGVLTLRASGNLNIGDPTATTRGTNSGALNDGFETATSAGLLPGASWSYRLVAGADQTSANPLAVKPLYDLADAGDFKVANGTPGTSSFFQTTPPQVRVVRTGTGDIDIAAARDLILGNAQSVVYTAGEPSTGVDLNALGGRAYPDNGGDVRLHAGRDARGVEGNQLVNQWLFRAGNASSATGWTVAHENFQQGIGALGGGDVQINAGRDIDNLSAVIPSIGKQIGDTTSANSQVEVIGGGDLSIEAGRDIASGLFYVGQGEARIHADGAVESNRNGANGPLHTVLALGDGTIDVQTRATLDLESVFNPTLVAQNSTNGSFTQKSFFSTYSTASAVSLTSLSGSVSLHNDTDGLARASGLLFNGAAGDLNALALYPGTLSTHALQGNVELHGSVLWMSPAPKGNLQLFAAGNVEFSKGLTLNMSDADPATLPDATQPSNSFASAYAAFLGFGKHAITPVHADAAQADGVADSVPVRIVTLDGDIHMLSENLSADAVKLLLPESARLIAGRDIRDVELVGQNLRSSDATTLMAGRDIVYSVSRSPEGSLQINQRDITLDGPGLLELIAGRDINLGTSPGVQTRGNGFNPSLAEQGAGVLVLAGTNALATADFIADYARYFVADSFAAQFREAVATVVGSQPSDDATAQAVYRELTEDQQASIMVTLGLPSRYAGSFTGRDDDAGHYQAGYLDDLLASQARLINFVREHTAESGLSESEALQRFGTLDESLQRQFVIQTLFNELKWSGRVEARTGNNEYPLGFDAIKTLFPAENYAGDIRMVLSTIRSLKGGDITLLAPGGRINAGLSTPPASLGEGKAAGDLGVVAQSRGDVHVFADSDIQVEESRIFAGDGGDILAWSSNGDVDAGRGSKAALSVPPPTITFNTDGSVSIDAGGSLTGSGIRAFASSEGVVPGDVDLFAPRGVVNAGDAGIGGGNITLGATAILGADNIDVGGISVGVPVADTGSLAAGLTGISNLSSSVSKMAEDSASSLGGDENAFNSNQTLGFLSVEILGFGE